MSTPALEDGSIAHQPDKIDSPLELRHITLTFDNSNPDHSAEELVQEYDPAWTNKDGNLKFVRFTEGITNTLTKVTNRRPGRSEREIEQDAILIRAYGKGTDVLIDRVRELKSHDLLARLGLAPALLARFNNGLMYRFIEGQPCSSEDLRQPKIYRQVARRLGQWHGTLPISAITTTPLYDMSLGQEQRDIGQRSRRPLPNCWTVMRQWIEALPSDTDERKERNQVLQAELATLSARFGESPGLYGKDYVFAHCDLLSGNVIVTQSSDKSAAEHSGQMESNVSFIDYEYATPSPAAFDIANHFAEWAGFDCDHGAVPTRSERRDFLAHYVASFRYHTSSGTEATPDKLGLQPDIEKLFDQVDQFRGIPGFYWGIWALIQATISQLDFDYANYAELRLGEYWAWKAEEDGSRAHEGRKKPIREARWAEN